MLYPLRFQPIFRQYVWGGRRLQTALGKSLPAGNDYAESWEIVARGRDQSVVSVGPLHGHTLSELADIYNSILYGRHAPLTQFPLLLKFLDANRDLSVQVHPNDQQAACLEPPDLGKTEAWVVLAKEPSSTIYAGLVSSCDRAQFRAQVAGGNCLPCLHRFTPQLGDCIFIPAGTVHALGAGLLVAEIQQASDTTYRIYDWDRLGADGHPRPLHINQALDVIDFSRGPIGPQVPCPTSQPHIERLVACEKFVLDRWRWQGSARLPDDERFHMIAVLQGEVRVDDDPCDKPLGRGDTMLIPAIRHSPLHLCGVDALMLDIYLPSGAV